MTSRQGQIAGIRTSLRKAAIDCLQAANALEDYKYEATIANAESSTDHLQAAVKNLKGL